MKGIPPPTVSCKWMHFVSINLLLLFHFQRTNKFLPYWSVYFFFGQLASWFRKDCVCVSWVFYNGYYHCLYDPSCFFCLCSSDMKGELVWLKVFIRIFAPGRHSPIHDQNQKVWSQTNYWMKGIPLDHDLGSWKQGILSQLSRSLDIVFFYFPPCCNIENSILYAGSLTIYLNTGFITWVVKSKVLWESGRTANHPSRLMGFKLFLILVFFFERTGGN